MFDDQAVHVLQGVAYDTLHSDPVSLALPVLPRGHAVFVAFQGDLDPTSGGAFGGAHRVVPLPETSVALEVPEPRTLLRPDIDAAIDAASEFAWSEGPGVSTFSLTCQSPSVRFYVVTAENDTRAPDVPVLHPSLPAGTQCTWRVEVHGAFDSVDAAASASGMIDACEYAVNCGRAILLEDGTIAVSARRKVRVGQLRGASSHSADVE